MSDSEAREALVAYSRACIQANLSNATAGNISLRTETGMIITPSGVPPEDMQPEMMVPCSLDGEWQGSWKVSSEWALHAALYRQRFDAAAVVHAHPTHCVALASLRRPLPAFHYMVAGFGGNEVPCAPYETFGSPALAETVATTLGQRYHACLMANHGMIAVGADISSAFLRTKKLEALAQQYTLARSIGEPVLLQSDEMAQVHRAYGTYGYEAPAENTDTD